MKEKGQNILYGVAALLLPGIFLFYLFNANKSRNSLYLSHFVVAALVSGLVSILLFIICKKIVRGRTGALVILLVWWGWFFTFEAANDFFLGHWPWFQRRYLAIAIVLILTALGYVLRRRNTTQGKEANTFVVLPMVLLCLFFVNFGQTLYGEVLIRPTGVAEAEKSYQIKTEFVIDESLPVPDIYWIHMDGAMNFADVEKFFGDTQEEVKNELTKRGFILNEDAKLHGGYTHNALAAMLSPTFYDSLLGELLRQNEHILSRERQNRIWAGYGRAGIDLERDVTPFYELFHAFMAKGYRVITITEPNYTTPLIDILFATTPEYGARPFMSLEDEAERGYSKWREMYELLTATTPLVFFKGAMTRLLLANVAGLPIPEYADEVDSLADRTLLGRTADSGIWREERSVWRMLLHTPSIPSPKLHFIVNNISHWPYDKIYATGKYTNPSPHDPYDIDQLYLPNLKYAIEVTLITIDMIMARDPDAVIILQGDHGLNVWEAEDYMFGAGYSQDDILEMNYSTLSAVRIPARYGGLSQPLDPLDLTRYLVNNFVGENYRMVGE